MLVSTTLIVAGLSLAVPVSAVVCSPAKPYSPLKPKTHSVQRDEKCRELIVDAPLRDLISKKVLKQALSDVSAVFDPADAFTLHSNPDAPSIIYLDFDGQSWQSGMWWIGSYGITAGSTSPGYTLDGNPSTFTTLERNAIYEIWRNVAEDFAMFDVDVTTERPSGTRDTIFRSSGSHALILSDTSAQSGCGCGGVAYVDVYDNGNTWNYPALNFMRFGDYFAPPWDTAEIISHEVGHNLGLAHDGTSTGTEYYGGHSMWAPIMGAGRGRGIATWSYGGYPSADTRWDQTAGDDDFAQMSLYLDLFNDDYGNTIPAAYPLSATEISNGISGLITTQNDVDMFELVVTSETAGPWTIDLIPSDVAPNLDPELTLLNSLGTILEVSNPSVPTGYAGGYVDSGLDASITYTLSEGTYYLKVDGIGQGSLSASTGYDDYASRGNYRLDFGGDGSGGGEDIATVSQVSPQSGGAGTAVKVQGTGFSTVTNIRLNGSILANFTVVDDSTLIFGVPSGSSSGTLVLGTANGNVTALSSFNVTRRNARPRVSTISPEQAGIGSEIVVSGTNLGAVTEVRLAGQEIDFAVLSERQLSFTVTESMSSGRIQVFTAGGNATSRRDFTPLVPLSISSISPLSGAVGSTLVINGSNFTSGTVVTFYGGAVASRPSISSNRISVAVPSGASSGPITVSNALGSSTSIENFTVTVAPPSIRSVSPSRARIGQTVTVNGSNFINVSSVEVNGVNATFSVVSATRLRFVVPAGATTGYVTVTTPGGTATSRSQLRIR